MERIEIENILDDIGIPLNLIGYRYTVEAVIQMNKDPFIPICNIYKNIAEKFDTSPSSAERNIRHTYENNKDNIIKYFNLKSKLNNGIFIAAIERKIRRNRENKNIKEREEI